MMHFALMVLLAVVVARTVASFVLRHAEALGLIQVPNVRSSHVRPTPAGGGIGIVAAGSLAAIILTDNVVTDVGLVAILAVPVAVFGLWDDMRQLSPVIRLVIQLAVVGAMWTILGRVPTVYFSPGLALLDVALTAAFLVAGAWWINLFNFMDGIDGIAGAQAMFMLSAGAGLAAWQSPSGIESPVFIWMVCLAAATFGFLLLNWPPAKIFMGDVGSTYLAFTILGCAFLTIRSGSVPAAAWLVLGALFIVDASVTLMVRTIHGARWTDAHRSHAYQRLARLWGQAGNGHRRVTMLAIAIDILWLAPLAWACTAWPEYVGYFMVLAYMPLVLAVISMGAGRTDEA